MKGKKIGVIVLTTMTAAMNTPMAMAQEEKTGKGTDWLQ